MTSSTRLIEGAAPREDDAKLFASIDRALKGGIEGSTLMRLGIRNEAGRVYRQIDAYGMNQFVRVCNALDRLGFVDEAPEDGRQVEGFDCLFRKG